MSELKKHCDTCAYSYMGTERNEYAEGGFIPVQRCSNRDYNASGYTNTMLREDWGRGHCRFWAPKTQQLYI